MFCGSAAGKIIPPYVVYKAEKIWLTWMEGGPPNTRYNRSKSGWFDATIFTDWFLNLFVPYVKKYINGRVVLLGDNLSSHFTQEVLSSAERNNITFACLPKNATHLTQPLDVGFYGPLKRRWREILDNWKQSQKKNSQTIQKDHFPRLLKKLTEVVAPNNYSQNLISGFKKCGISPFNSKEVLNRLPQENNHDQNSTPASTMVSSIVVDMLKNMRYGDNSDAPKKRRSKVNVQAGASISVEDLLLNKPPQVSLPSCSTVSTKKRPKKSSKKNESDDQSSVSEEDIHYMDSSEDENWETYCEKQLKEQEREWSSDDEQPLAELSNAIEKNETQLKQTSEFKALSKENEMQIDVEEYHRDINECIEVDDYLLVSFKTSSKCNSNKYYVGKVVANDPILELSFLRNKNLKFFWPNVVDHSIIEKKQIVLKLKKPLERKRYLVFEELHNKTQKIE